MNFPISHNRISYRQNMLYTNRIRPARRLKMAIMLKKLTYRLQTLREEKRIASDTSLKKHRLGFDTNALSVDLLDASTLFACTDSESTFSLQPLKQTFNASRLPPSSQTYSKAVRKIALTQLHMQEIEKAEEPF